MPTYQLIPQATDLISQSQDDILTNFTSIQQLVDINHVDFSDGVNYGKHKWVAFPVQTDAQLPTFLAGEDALYNNLPTIRPLTGINELWIHKQNATGSVDIPMTASILSYNAAPNTGQQFGWSYLPSGILLKWGLSPAFLDNTFGQTFNIIDNTVLGQQPQYTQILSVQVTSYVSSLTNFNRSIYTVSVPNTSTIGIYAYNPAASSGATSQVFYMTIGY